MTHHFSGWMGRDDFRAASELPDHLPLMSGLKQ